MSKLRHTSGPWNIEGNDIIGDKALICETYNDYDFAKNPHRTDINRLPSQRGEASANAKLIAAAPELLEACEWAVEQFKRLSDEGKYPEFMMAENGGSGYSTLTKAIKKATE